MIAARELWRKSIHFSGIFFLPILLWRRDVFVSLLTLFLIAYLLVEICARRGVRIPILSALTERCKRPSEQGRLSRGALFLVISGIVTPYLFGSAAAALGLAQVFVADTVSTLVGMQWGTVKLPYSEGKSWAGSIAFFLSAFFLGLYFTAWPKTLLLAAVGAILESLPIPEADNLTIPLAVGLAARFGLSIGLP